MIVLESEQRVRLDDSSTSFTVSTRPPVDDTRGTVPYCMACSWIRPQGSKRLGTSRKSAPVAGGQPACQVHTATNVIQLDWERWELHLR